MARTRTPGDALKETFHFPKDLAVRIPGRLGTTCVGAVTDLRTGGGRRWVMAEFPPPGTPLFTIGDRVPLEFSGPSMPSVVTAEAEVVLWSFNDAAFTYGFQVDAETKESLLGAVHRHRARRVEFSAATRPSIRLAVSPGDAVFDGAIENLSVGGLGALVSHAADEALKSSYELLLAFELPECEGLLELVARPRWRSMAEGQVRYGVQFAPGPTVAPQPQPQLHLIERFIAARDRADADSGD